ncbi:MAG: XdhC family protein [Acidobacteria bacterium]|nr:XdhC family protein [Acidobacteriota bacterium]
MRTAIPTQQLYEKVSEALSRGKRVVIATVVETLGSTPQRSGAKLIVSEDGRMVGTVGGGCVEAEVWAQAREVLRRGRPGLFTFHLADDPEKEDGDVCGGTMKIFLDLWSPER